MNGKTPNESNDENGNPDDLAADIVGIEEYDFSVVPPKKQFLPWHRPRKQFVRNDQWGVFIAELLDEVKPETLTYFGLPGVDLLDIRFFGNEICEPRRLKLRFLGFNSSADPESNEQAELNISLDEISKSASFDPQSAIIPDDLRQLVNEDSIAWQKTFELGPYDVVNLDLCDGFGAQEPGEINETYYNAVSKLLAVQMRKKSPWLLLLTTRVGKGHIHAETLERLSNLYNSNLRKCAPFRKASAETFNISDPETLQKAKRDNAGLQSIFLVGICKWLLHFSAAQNPPSKMVVKSLLGYRVQKNSKIEDMISIAIRFDPTHGPLKDPSKLATIKAAKIDECEEATNILKKVSKLFDVDDYLSSQTAIRDEMIDAMCRLLDSARYDITAYRKWVAEA